MRIEVGVPVPSSRRDGGERSYVDDGADGRDGAYRGDHPHGRLRRGRGCVSFRQAADAAAHAGTGTIGGTGDASNGLMMRWWIVALLVVVLLCSGS
jgi:hypothetical protein